MTTRMPDAHDPHAADATDALGPVDVRAWGAGVIGILLGLAVALGFVLATSAPGG